MRNILVPLVADPLAILLFACQGCSDFCAGFQPFGLGYGNQVRLLIPFSHFSLGIIAPCSTINTLPGLL